MKFLKLMTTAAAICVLCLAAISTSAQDVETPPENGTVSDEAALGSQENPYVISDKSGLENLADLTAKGLTKDVYFELGCDIELNSPALFTYTEGELTQADEKAVKWTPAGSKIKPFQGVLDGKGHYITGLYVDNTNQAGGLFAVMENATVKNLNLDFSLVDAKEYAGGIAGKMKGSSTISGCVVYDSVIGKQQELASVTGGIAGSVGEGSMISDCCFYGAVTGSNAFSANAGGIAGINNGLIEKCTFGGRTYGVSMYFGANVGGIAGSNHGSITGCLSQGKVGAESAGEINESNAGGIAGYSDGYIAQCKNESYVSGYCASFADSISTAGGIAGYVKNSDVYGCENNGEIAGLQGVYAGGSAGLSVLDNGEHKIYDCLNNGSVSSEYGLAGGICARVSASGYVTYKNEVISCVNTATVNGSSFGGVAGFIYKDGAAVSAQNCYYPAGYTDGFAEGTASVAKAGFTSGTALEGLTNADVWSFESGKLPAVKFADGLARKTSTITAESTQTVTAGGTVAAQGVGTMTLSKPLTIGVHDVIVRFSGNEESFAPRSAVVNVTVAPAVENLLINSVDASSVTVSEGKVSGKVKVQMYSPKADAQYTVISSVLVGGVYQTSTFTPHTTQSGFYEAQFDIAPATVADGAQVVINTMIVENTDSMAPVCENVKTEVK